MITIPKSLVTKNSTYFGLKVKGLSMIDEGIFDGDIAIIKKTSSAENGKILFKHPKNLYMITNHWPEGLIEKTNEVTSQYFSITPQSNMLLIFPSWVEHKVGTNLKDDTKTIYFKAGQRDVVRFINTLKERTK